VKKTQRSFAVEYKSGRRKIDAKPNSIWGSMDLKSVARDVEEEAMPFLPKTFVADELDTVMSAPEVNPTPPILTPPVATPTSAEETRGMFMADDTDTIDDAEAPALEEAPVAQKKQRKPRAKRTSLAAGTDTTADTASGGIDGRKKQGRKASVSEGPVAAKRRAPKVTPEVDQIVDEVVPSAGDEMADLLQLEAENQKLRKLLAEKLRAENADLRKKLKLY
jgi:hypothetical protein